MVYLKNKPSKSDKVQLDHLWTTEKRQTEVTEVMFTKKKSNLYRLSAKFKKKTLLGEFKEVTAFTFLRNISKKTL